MLILTEPLHLKVFEGLGSAMPIKDFVEYPFT